MMNDFEKILEGVEAEAFAEGEAGVSELRALDRHFGLGAKLVRRRTDLKISQQALAEKSGIAQSEISRIEQGMGNPTLATVWRLADALGATSLDFTWA